MVLTVAGKQEPWHRNRTLVLPGNNFNNKDEHHARKVWSLFKLHTKMKTQAECALWAATSLLICMTTEKERCCSQVMNVLDNPPAVVCLASQYHTAQIFKDISNRNAEKNAPISGLDCSVELRRHICAKTSYLAWKAWMKGAIIKARATRQERGSSPSACAR